MSSIAERTTAPNPPSANARAARRARARIIDRTMTGVLWVLVAAIVAVLVYFIGYTLVQGIGVINLEFLTSGYNNYDGPALFNTFYIIIGALIVCIPLGIGSAIYLVEYAKQGRFTTIVQFATEMLAGVPSLILGFFGYLIFVTAFGYGTRFGYSRLAGILTLAVLNLPLIVRISQDALASVSGDLREASAAVGATKSQTVLRVLLPTALPQFTTGVILTAGKMMGETAALIFTSGTSSPTTGWLTLNPLFPGPTLTVHLFELQAEGIAHNAAAVVNGTATLLIVLLLIFNLGLRGLAGLLNRRLSGSR